MRRLVKINKSAKVSHQENTPLTLYGPHSCSSCLIPSLSDNPLRTPCHPSETPSLAPPWSLPHPLASASSSLSPTADVKPLIITKHAYHNPYVHLQIAMSFLSECCTVSMVSSCSVNSSVWSGVISRWLFFTVRNLWGRGKTMKYTATNYKVKRKGFSHTKYCGNCILFC